MPRLNEYKPIAKWKKCQDTENYFCKCVACKYAIDHASYLKQRQEDLEYELERCGKLSDILMKEVV